MNNIKITKPQYIRKYDFIHYFNRPKEQWFWKNSDLEEFIKSKCNDIQDGDDADFEEDDEEFEDVKEDPLELLKELKSSSSDKIDLTDPKIYEGNLIDKEARKFLSSRVFLKEKHYQVDVVDFDEKYPNEYDFSFLEKETSKLLEKDNWLAFQPVFIFKNKAIARPDALLKINGQYTIIEVKGTSKIKASQIVDLLYQSHIVNSKLNQFDTYVSNYLVCLIKYEKLEKNGISFITSDRGCLTKGGKDWNKKEKESYPGLLVYSDEAIKLRGEKRIGLDSSFSVLDVLSNNTNEFENRELKTFTLNIENLLDINNFENIIDELIDFQTSTQLTLNPEHCYKTWFSDYAQLALVRKYYFLSKWMSCYWSGKVFSIKQQIDCFKNNFKNEIQIRDYFKFEDKNGKFDEKDKIRFFSNFRSDLYTMFYEGCYKTTNTLETWKKLKNKKVYFDFESINPATRVIDDTTPYTQIVTQVSVIYDDGDKKLSNAINIVKDPLTINITDFKEIVDSIYRGEDYSYVVYNKAFETTRLKEIAYYINEEAYTHKIEAINNNIYDLADFFDPNKNLITINELHGWYSIKNVLPVVEKVAKHLWEKAGCKDYHKLEGIQNGGEALNRTSQRFFKLLDDKQWDTIVHQLKIYCENDVRAMIAVEYYLASFLNIKLRN